MKTFDPPYHLYTRHFVSPNGKTNAYEYRILKNNKTFLQDGGNINHLTRRQARAIVKLLNELAQQRTRRKD